MPQDCCHDNACCRWAVGSNMPGYMPDSEPRHLASYDEAIKCHLGDIDAALDDEAQCYENGPGAEFDELESEFESYRAILEKRRAEGKELASRFRVGQYLYWLEPL